MSFLSGSDSAAMPKTGGDFTGRVTMKFGADITTGGVITLGTDGNSFHLTTSTAAITDFTAITGSGPFFLITDTVRTITHAAGVLETNTGADITTAAGDRFRLDQDSDGTTWLITQEGGSADADTSLSNLTATGNNKIASAWVNFNGTGTVAIRDSFNVSSITDTGVGSYVVNYATAMLNANYAESVSTQAMNNWNHQHFIGGSGTTTTFSITNRESGGASDPTHVSLLIFGGK